MAQEQTEQSFKEKLALVFDEDLRTRPLHFADDLKNHTASTVNDQENYQQFITRFSETMKEEFGLATMSRSPRYPLLKKNLGYFVRGKHPSTNVFVLRPSSELMNFNTRKLAIAYRMAQLISEHFDGGRGMTDADMADLKKGGFGYLENEGLKDGD